MGNPAHYYHYVQPISAAHLHRPTAHVVAAVAPMVAEPVLEEGPVDPAPSSDRIPWWKRTVQPLLPLLIFLTATVLT